MADIWSHQKRSEVMAKIRGRNTKPEILVRKILHSMGYRFTVNGPKNRRLPGRPDIVLPRFKTVIFVHGCFWHRHEGRSNATMPKTRPQFWQEKFDRTVERDREKQSQLESAGWRVLTVWECELKTDPTKLAYRLKNQILGSHSSKHNANILGIF